MALENFKKRQSTKKLETYTSMMEATAKFPEIIE